MDALIIENNEIKGIETNTGKTFLGPVILATGHSARDVYRWLAANNVTIEAKGIAVGVRLEHPATLIDQIQYHNKNGRENISLLQNIVSSPKLKAEACIVSVCVPAALSSLQPADRSKW